MKVSKGHSQPSIAPAPSEKSLHGSGITTILIPETITTGLKKNKKHVFFRCHQMEDPQGQHLGALLDLQLEGCGCLGTRGRPSAPLLPGAALWPARPCALLRAAWPSRVGRFTGRRSESLPRNKKSPPPDVFLFLNTSAGVLLLGVIRLINRKKG